MSQIYNGTFVLGNTSATTLSAGTGIKLDTSVPGTIKISNDETVLYSGNYSTATTGINFNESIKNFDRIKVCWQHQNRTVEWSEYPNDTQQWYHTQGRTDNGTSMVSFYTMWNPTNNSAVFFQSWYFHCPTSTNQWTFGATGLNEVVPIKVVGINRLSNT